MISGKPVTSDTSVTASPESRSAFDVPPVESSVTPCRARPLAKSTKPDLSDTESNARRTGRSVIGADSGAGGLRPLLLPDDPKEKRQNDAGDERRCQRQVELHVVIVDMEVARQRREGEIGDRRAQHQRA